MKLLATLLIAFAIAGSFADEPEKLVNGTPTSIQRYPHCISIRTSNSHMCGGSIISSRFILTAGHCVAPLLSDASLRSRAVVVSGTTYLNSGGQSHKIAKLHLHPSYRDTSGRPAGYDIGIIELATPIQFSSTQQPIKLPTRDVSKGESVSVVAWGSTGFRKQVHNDLQNIDAQLMLPDECERYHRPLMSVSKLEFCTLIRVGTGACNGDSGSGVVRNSDGTIVGLVSGGRPCALGYPDIYTSVYPFLPWIKQITNL